MIKLKNKMRPIKKTFKKQILKLKIKKRPIKK